MLRSAIISIAVVFAAILPAQAASFVVCDSGIRCIRAPCPSTNVMDLRSRRVSAISGVDFGRLPPRDRQRISRSGANVLEGALRTRPFHGPIAGERESVLVVSRVGRKASAQELRMCQTRRGR